MGGSSRASQGGLQRWTLALALLLINMPCAAANIRALHRTCARVLWPPRRVDPGLIQRGYRLSVAVQGVWFRACAVEKAKELGVVGWCMNTRQGTVKGEVQGKKPDVEQMKVWLATEGSPMSHIERCDFTDERHDIESLEYSDFAPRHR